MRFLRAEEIKELLAWTAQELQTVQDSAAQGNPASGAVWSLFLRYDDDLPWHTAFSRVAF